MIYYSYFILRIDVMRSLPKNIDRIYTVLNVLKDHDTKSFYYSNSFQEFINHIQFANLKSFNNGIKEIIYFKFQFLEKGFNVIDTYNQYEFEKFINII